MKRFLQLIVLLIFIGISATNAQERHYSYRYSGTTYKAKGGGQTAMGNKASSCLLKGEFIASILPDHKTLWLYSSAINERCTGKGVCKDGGYSYNAPLSEGDIYRMVIGGAVSVGDYSIFIKSDHSRITCISTEEDGEYYSVRYDHYNRISAVAAPKNSKRSELERKEAERKASSERLEKELAEERAQREREQKAFDAKLQSSIGSEFPMAHFIDSHGNRVSSSYFKRGKKTLVITYMVGCTPNRLLKEFLKGYPEIASQIINIYLSQTSYSKFKKNTSAPVRTDRIYYNPDEGNNSKWIYGRSYPCIILLDERGYVLDYQFGFDKEDDMDYMMDIINQLRGRSSNGAPYQVGDYYNDGKMKGIVFEVYDNGYSGKIVSLKHSDKIKKWREHGSLDIGKTFGVTDGEDIMRYRDLSEDIYGDDAFSWCRRMGAGWYLPTIEELKAIYKNKAIIEPKLTNKLERYWSCTEYNADKAYCIEKGTGYVWHSEKYYGCYVRAVKTFGKRVPRAKQKTTSAPYKVGDFYNENGKTGIVFEVNSDGTSGKIVEFHPWGQNSWTADKQLMNSIIGANSKTDGQYNTNVVMRTNDWEKKYPAFEYCTRYIDKGWYIPSINELKSIYNAQRSSCIRLPKGMVWSSTEHVNNRNINTLALNLHTGESSVESKGSKFYIYVIAPFGKKEQTAKRTLELTSAPYKIGDLYNDGIKCGVVVETWNDGLCGKIISLTETLEPWDDAKATCKTMGKDWYLPSIDELRLLSYNKAEYEAINKGLKLYGTPIQTEADYWSETLTGNTIHKIYPTAYSVAMDGSYTAAPTGNGYYVRAFSLFGDVARPTTTLARSKTSAPYKVGDYYNDGEKDGIVFEVSAGGRHGKIVSMCQPLSRIVWSTNPILYLSAKSKSDGVVNMEKVKQQSGWRATYPAFRWCDDLGEGWYLPAINEMKVIIEQSEVLNRGLIDKLNGIYLSSTESKKRPEDCKASNVTSAIAITIGEGKGFVTEKDHCRYLGGYKVRAVAKF